MCHSRFNGFLPPGKGLDNASITLNNGYRVTGIAPASGVTTVAVNTFSASGTTTQTAVLAIVGKGSVNVAVTYSDTDKTTDETAAGQNRFKQDFESWVNTNFAGETNAMDPGAGAGVTAWMDLYDNAGASVSSIYATQKASVNDEATLLAAQKAVTKKLAAATFWHLNRLVGTVGFADVSNADGLASDITVTGSNKNAWMENSAIKTAYAKAVQIMGIACATTGTTGCADDAADADELAGLIKNIKASYDTGATSIINAINALIASNTTAMTTAGLSALDGYTDITGISVDIDDNTATVVKDDTKLATWINANKGNSLAPLNSNKKTSIDVGGFNYVNSSTPGEATVLCVGVRVKAPAGTASVQVSYNGATVVKEKLDDANSNLVTDSDIYYTFYVPVAVRGNKAATDWTIQPIVTQNFTYQFFGDATDGTAHVDIPLTSVQTVTIK